MSQFDSHKDYYEILGANERTSHRDLERLYKRMAAQRHPDKGGSEEEMKTLNEAYRVLKDEENRKKYDLQRLSRTEVAFVSVSSSPAQNVGLLGHSLSAFFCLLVGLFLLFLVRFQWIWFLWPLAILAGLVILSGIMMARGAMRAANASLPLSNRVRRHAGAQEIIFWAIVVAGAYGVYLVMLSV